ENKKNYLRSIIEAELFEEAGIVEENIEEIEVLGLAQSYKTYMGLVGLTKLKINKHELLNAFKKNSDVEMKNLVFIEKENLKDFVENKLVDYRNQVLNLLDNNYD